VEDAVDQYRFDRDPRPEAKANRNHCSASPTVRSCISPSVTARP
jgi:hypothetical protein